jgi:hypothetical protein
MADILGRLAISVAAITVLNSNLSSIAILFTNKNGSIQLKIRIDSFIATTPISGK